MIAVEINDKSITVINTYGPNDDKPDIFWFHYKANRK